MRFLILILIIACGAVMPAAGLPGGSHEDAARPRVAVIGFSESEGAHRGKAAQSLTEALRLDARISVIDPSQAGPALAGSGYGGSINLSSDEARNIGAAIGCDFFITGKVDTSERSERRGESHYEAIVGLMIVDGRNGLLAAFDFILEKAPTAEAAYAAACREMTGRARGYADRLRDYRAARAALPLVAVAGQGEPIEEMPEEGSARAVGFKPPEFIGRVKPEYTEQADRANVIATVEALAVFRANGEVGEIRIVRWAGFGLDESAAAAIRQLQFKPATRDGKPVSVRALIRYNFRRFTMPQ